jgi:hypothetical protein
MSDTEEVTQEKNTSGVVNVPVGPPLSWIPLAPPDLPSHTQAIVNTSREIWIGDESFLFYKQSKVHWTTGTLVGVPALIGGLQTGLVLGGWVCSQESQDSWCKWHYLADMMKSFEVYIICMYYMVGLRGAIHVNHLQAPCGAFFRWDLSWCEHVNVGPEGRYPCQSLTGALWSLLPVRFELAWAC